MIFSLRNGRELQDMLYYKASFEVLSASILKRHDTSKTKAGKQVF
jgi:hypothetical protein